MDISGDKLQRSNFYQAVRLLLARPGGRAWQLKNRVRFSAELSHAFPGREISAVAEDGVTAPGPGAPEETPRYRISTPNYCVAGGLGPLPPAYTEWLRDQVRAGNRASVHFLDLFNHRLNLTRYQLKESCTPGLNNRAPEDALLGRRLAALCGLGETAEAAPAGRRPGLPDAPAATPSEGRPVPLRSLLGIAGLLTDCRRNASGLTRVLARYLGAPVELTPFVGAWRPIEDADRMTLGRRNHGLGQGAVLGTRVWDQQARVRLTVGPIDYSLFRRLLPPRPGQRPDVLHLGLVELVSVLLNRRHDCEVRLEVRPETVGESVLTARPTAGAADAGRNEAGLQLGESAWLGSPRSEARPAAEFLIPAFGEVSA